MDNLYWKSLLKSNLYKLTAPYIMIFVDSRCIDIDSALKLYGNRVTVSLKTLLRLYESYVENYKNGIGCSIDIPGKYVPRPVRLIIASTGYICGAKIFIDNEWLFLCTMPMYRDNCDTLCIHMPRYENLCIIIGQ